MPRLATALATHATRLLCRTLAALLGGFARVDPLDLCDEDARILDVGVRDRALERRLRAHGRRRYLGLADPAGWTGPLPRRFVRHARPATLPRSNADVVVVRGRAGPRLRRFNDYARARWVLWEPAGARDTALGALGLLINLVRGRVTVPGHARLPAPRGPDRACIAVRVRASPRPVARRHLSPLIGVDGFLRGLDAAGVRHAVLRWFDGLPELPEGEDLDLLVEDDGVAAAEAILAREPGTVPVDLYSVSGLPRTDYGGTAYYPPRVARRILDRAVRTGRGYRVPCPEDHFHSLAYHALYHKGEASGLGPDGDAEPEHDYAAVLERLARAAGVDVSITMRELDDHLDRAGWRPPRDTLARLARRNDWVRERLRQSADAYGDAEEWTGLAVFFIRERALEHGVVDAIVDRIAAEGFHVLCRRRLTAAARRRVAGAVRGANWGRGPWPVSGGGPAVAVVAFDLSPIPPDARWRRRYPRLDNARVLVKKRIRTMVNGGLAPGERCNVLHSSDDAADALHYLRLAAPDAVEAVRAEIAALRARFATPEPVLRRLPGAARRAKLEVVERGGRLAVRKTFRPGLERMAAREAFVMGELGRERPEVPALLEAGRAHVVYPYHDDARPLAGRGLLPLEAARRAVELIRFFYERGYTLVDFRPDDLAWSPTAGLRATGFELLHRYRVRPASFERAWELAGVPPEFDGDRPPDAASGTGWDARWKPRVGLELDRLLHDPAWRQRLERARHRTRRSPGALYGLARRAARRAAAVSRARGWTAELDALRERLLERTAEWARW